MSSKNTKINIDSRAIYEIRRLLDILKINKLNENNICDLEDLLDSKVVELANAKDSYNEIIDNELLRIYDLLTDIIMENEDNIDFLNKLFFE